MQAVIEVRVRPIAYVSHGGAIDGYLRFLLYFPERDIAIAVLTNAFPVPIYHPPIIAVAVANAAPESL